MDSPTAHIQQPSDFDVLPTREGYDRWSAIYDAEDNPLVALETPQTMRLLGNVRGKTLLDVGCGTGRHAVALAVAGAAVTAVDFSEGMLSAARRRPGAEAVRFLQHDLHERLPFADASFDRVLCSLVLEHIQSLTPFFAEIRRVCRRDGYAVFSAMHPAMMLRGITARFRDPATGRDTRPHSCRHQISDIVMSAQQAGLSIDAMSEHAVDEAQAARSERAAKYLDWPMLLMLRFRAGGLGVAAAPQITTGNKR